jgi:phenylacetate-CoA ligase
VAVALAEPYGSFWATAAAGVAQAAASLGPRGRMRAHHALGALGATALVCTPTGAMDLLARLHLEFLLDPLDLGLRRIVLVGEIASRRTAGHLAGEFEATVTEVLASPFTGSALGWRHGEAAPLTPVADIGVAALGKDAYLDGAGPAELVEITRDDVLRTGLAGEVTAPGQIPAPAHTVGDHVLVRGLWLSLPRLERALAKIDGVAAWTLTVSRPGTLDSAVLTVAFSRPSLVKNPMWQARIRESLRAVSPVSIAVEVSEEVMEIPLAGVVDDQRGHHLGRDRSTPWA